MRTLVHAIFWFVSGLAACQDKPEWSACGDGQCAEDEDPERCPSDCAKDGEDDHSGDDRTDGGRSFTEEQLENPRDEAEARAACNRINTCGNHGICLTPTVRRGQVERFIHPTPLQACGHYLELNAMVALVSGELVLQIEQGEVIIAIFADWDNCRPVGEFPCDASTVAMADVTAGMVVYWFVAGGDGSEFEIGVGGGEKVSYTLRWEIRD